MRVLLALLILAFAGPSALAGDGGSWKLNAVIYGVSASQLAQGYGIKPLEAVRRRLAEIRDLGANVLWLQPVSTPSDPQPGQGYDVIDFLQVNPRLGSASDLRALVQQAHLLGIRVILDVPLNHTSIKHPFAQDVIRSGKASAYYEFYQHQPWPKVPYAQFFHLRTEGKGDFTYYFWQDLVNLNYDNPRVREYAIQDLVYWVQNFDVDGYRLDASWGPETRWPEFYRAVSAALHAIKPDIFLLAEDKAGFPAA